MAQGSPHGRWNEVPFSDADLRALERLNTLRRGPLSTERTTLEARFSSRFGAESSLAVYGSLAPGRPNHHLLAPLAGRWVEGLTARGELVNQGWGSDLGYPALRWTMSGSPIPVELFLSAELVDHWERLDRFEGPGYLRALVPLFRGREMAAVANLYVVAPT